MEGRNLFSRCISIFLIVIGICCLFGSGTFVEGKFSFKSAISKVKNSVSNKIKHVERKVKDRIRQVKDVSFGKWKNIKQKAKKKLFDSVSKVSNKLKNSANKKKQLFMKYSSKIKQQAKKLKGKYKKLSNKLKNSKIVKKIKEKSQKFKKSKFGRKISSKIETTKQALRKAGKKIDKIFSPIKKSLKKVSQKIAKKALKELNKIGKKISETKGWKMLKKQAKKLLHWKSGAKNDQTKGVTKLETLNGMNSNQKVTPKTSITAKSVELASEFSKANDNDAKSEALLKQQGYKPILEKDHKIEKIASKVWYNEKDKTLVVSYRGTDVNSVVDWGNNFDMKMKPAYFNGKYVGKVHSGFYKHYMKDRKEINKLINQYQKEGKVSKIVFTGHSKGGALSELAATDYKLNHKNNAAKIELITFGNPRVGDKEHAQIVNKNIKDFVRVVNMVDKNGNGQAQKDIVAQMPPQELGFAHAGNEVQIECEQGGYASCHGLDNYMKNLDPK